MEYLDRLDELPPVQDAVQRPYEEYLKFAKGVLDFREYCQLGLAESLEKIQEWCVHLDCLRSEGLCAPATLAAFRDLASNVTNSAGTGTQSTARTLLYAASTTTSELNASATCNISHPIFVFMESIGFNSSSCYDDYLCDHAGMSSSNHFVLGFGCFIICLYGIVSNLVLLPAYNVGRNRCGATVYLSGMAVFDLIYLIFTLLIVVAHYVPDNYEEQMEMYGRFCGYLIPFGLPIMQFCELIVVWLVVAILANRLLFLKWGPLSKELCSQLQSLKTMGAIVILGLTYVGCKFFEYSYVEYKPIGVVRVVLTPLGNTTLFKNIMYHWLKVPLEMFLPYLSAGILISIIVQKMTNLHTSRWKAVASLCNDTACACVCRAGVCGKECREVGSQTQEEESSNNHSLDLPSPNGAEQPIVTPPSIIGIKKMAKSTTVLDPIEQELAYIFFQSPHLDETREYATVVTVVCIGFLMMLFKVPKFLLHVLSTEDYINFDPTLFALIDQFLATMFAACKPTVCIFVGAHFRRALLAAPSCCGSRLSPTNRIHRNTKQSISTGMELPALQIDPESKVAV
ncbi:unnamed protein product [Calicophoron daubneyi]|uniref:G-protein coupled receptors family 1 profile domain-containing protein n=1 Tax=Calicophoron daubneyi TaxID=300641 RepID=A0AAV2TDR4_CALDB